jgi:hypothetical protein
MDYYFNSIEFIHSRSYSDGSVAHFPLRHEETTTSSCHLPPHEALRWCRTTSRIHHRQTSNSRWGSAVMYSSRPRRAIVNEDRRCGARRRRARMPWSIEVFDGWLGGCWMLATGGRRATIFTWKGDLSEVWAGCERGLSVVWAGCERGGTVHTYVEVKSKIILMIPVFFSWCLWFLQTTTIIKCTSRRVEAAPTIL